MRFQLGISVARAVSVFEPNFETEECCLIAHRECEQQLFLPVTLSVSLLFFSVIPFWVSSSFATFHPSYPSARPTRIPNVGFVRA